MASTSSSTEIEGAFEGIAPPLSSSSTSGKMVPWDIFVSHRGADTKRNIATAIYKPLHHLGLRVFLDVEALQAGDVIPAHIEEAMRSASLHIAIFSEKYAQSPWCLAELAFMLKTSATVIPVFYNVQPEDLRWVAQGKGIYADAFTKHEEKGRYTSEKLLQWKEALHNVSFHSGYMVTSNDDEGWVLKNIVNRALEVMKKVPLEVAKHPVGLDEAVRDFETSTLESAHSDQKARVVGIVGLGGSGKTTLAKQIYNYKCSSFNHRSFLFDVRAAKQELHKKQMKLLRDVSFPFSEFDSTEEGKGILASRLSSLSVLIVLDDVDHPDQLDALLPATEKLASSSLVIVTSRELGMLKSWGITSIYKMPELPRSHAKQLLCWHAFLQPSPVDRFEDMVERLINICHGLPLSLKVFGGQLYRKPEEYWESHIDKISRILPEDIKGRLKISYDALDEEEQEMFLDVACFLIDEEKSVATAVWDGSGWSGVHSWDTLLNKCLVEVGEHNRIRMHDHLRDLGREIAIVHSPCRLWLSGQIGNNGEKVQERIPIRGIMADDRGQSIVNTSREFRGFCQKRFSLGLKLFAVRGGFLNKSNSQLSRELVWLRWADFQHTNLPRWLSLKNLSVLKLDGARRLKELWDVNADPPSQLRELIIEGCPRLQSFPKSIGRLKHLKKIVVDGCKSTMGDSTQLCPLHLPDEFCCLQSLEQLDLKNCNLSSLPTQFGDLTNLRQLNFGGCRNLRTLPVTFKKLIHLQSLDLSYCSKFNFTSENLDILENITKLENVSFYGCRELQELPPEITNQASLRALNLECRSLKELPSDIGQLSKLESLTIIGGRFLTSLPDSIGNLACLASLTIRDCAMLEFLPETLRQLHNLQNLIIDLCRLRELALTSECSASSLRNLKRIYLSGTQVSTISIAEDCCPTLETLRLQSNDCLREIETLPTTVREIHLEYCKRLKKIKGICGLVKLQKLVITECPELDELSSFTELASLKEFEMWGCEKVEKIEGLEDLRSLETLKVHTCRTVVAMAATQSLESTDRIRMRKVEVLADMSISALQPCIQRIPLEWPCEMIICGRAVRGVKRLAQSSLFSPDVSIIHRIANAKIERYYSPLRLKCVEKRSCNAAMLFLFINCLSEHMYLRVGGKDFRDVSMKLEEGRWVWIGIFTQRSPWHDATEYQIFENPSSYHSSNWLRCNKSESKNIVEEGILVKGELGGIREAFYRLMAYVGN